MQYTKPVKGPFVHIQSKNPLYTNAINTKEKGGTLLVGFFTVRVKADGVYIGPIFSRLLFMFCALLKLLLKSSSFLPVA